MFEPLDDELRAGRLLDIGIGAGRTTAYLAPKVGHYVGVDYSHGLVDGRAAALSRGRDPLVRRPRHVAFEDGELRLRELQLQRPRLARPRGSPAGARGGTPRAEARRTSGCSPATIATTTAAACCPGSHHSSPVGSCSRRARTALRRHKNWRRLRKEQVETPEYALVNDEAHDYALLHYYITPARAGRDSSRRLASLT